MDNTPYHTVANIAYSRCTDCRERVSPGYGTLDRGKLLCHQCAASTEVTVESNMTTRPCKQCKRNTLHYFMRLLGLWECDDCGAESKGE